MAPCFMIYVAEHSRNNLIESHRAYAHAIAWGMLRSLPYSVDRQEVLAVAEYGLVQAAQVYDPSLGVTFKTFSYYRIKGAIYDYLRKQRGAISTHEKFDEAATGILADYTDAHREESSREELRHEIESVGGGILMAYRLSLDSVPLSDSESETPEEIAIKNEGLSRLHSALQKLPDKYHQVMEGYYFKNLSMEEIGQRLGISKSWVCRLHVKGLRMLEQSLLKK